MLKYVTVLPVSAVLLIEREINLFNDSPLEASLNILDTPVGLEGDFRLVELIFLLPKKILRKSAAKHYTYKHQLQRKFTSLFAFREDGLLTITWGGRANACAIKPVVMLEEAVELVADDVHWLIRDDEITFIDEKYFKWIAEDAFEQGTISGIEEAITAISEHKSPIFSTRCFKSTNLQGFISDLIKLKERNPDSKASEILTFLGGMLVQILEINTKRNQLDQTIKNIKDLVGGSS